MLVRRAQVTGESFLTSLSVVKCEKVAEHVYWMSVVAPWLTTPWREVGRVHRQFENRLMSRSGVESRSPLV